MSAESAADLPHIGEVIAGKYRIDALLGRGGMGAVFRVTHLISEKQCALKWMLSESTANHESMKRFIQEAKVPAEVSHPNIVDVYDVGQDRGSLYMVMELLKGESLAERLHRVERVSAAEACRIILPIISAIEKAHSCGIIHRDLKPENIFLDGVGGEERPMVLDFGISKRILGTAGANAGSGVLTVAGRVFGTLHFSAPEHLRQKGVDARTDVYSLGVVLYRMLSGGLPFEGDDAELIAKVLRDPPTPLAERAPDVSSGLAQVVERAMAREPEDRYASARELGEALEPFAIADSRRRASDPDLYPVDEVEAPVVAPPPEVVEAESKPVAAPRRLRVPRRLIALGVGLFGVIGLIWGFVEMLSGSKDTQTDTDTVIRAGSAAPPPAAEAGSASTREIEPLPAHDEKDLDQAGASSPEEELQPSAAGATAAQPTAGASGAAGAKPLKPTKHTIITKPHPPGPTGAPILRGGADEYGPKPKKH